MGSQKNKLDVWASLRKEVYTTHEVKTIIKRYNDLFGVEVATSHTNHISVLIKKIVKQEVRELKDKKKSNQEIDDLINNLKFDLNYT
jgi:Holliday junction resolvasome RuvABC ATP-dependent DNA helicase subunit